MRGQGTTLSPVECEAIEALCDSTTRADAARVLGMSIKKLCRMMQNPVFEAEYEAATSAAFNHQKARQRQGVTLGVKSTIRIMQEGKKPADRLKAANILIRLAEDDQEISREFEVMVRKLEQAQLPATGRPCAGERPPGTGHGAKLPPTQMRAIPVLLEQRTLAEAALVSGVGVQTLCRWLHTPAFLAAFAAAVRAVWGQAMMIVRKYLPQAITLQRNFMIDPALPDAIKLQAVSGTLREAKADQMAALKERLANLESGPGEAEPGKSIASSLYRRVQRLKASLRQTTGPVVIPLTFMHAVDGKPGGTSVSGPDGLRVWVDPPPGCKAGEPVEQKAA
jgi:hypothetical protein